ncbi:hypothetical protein [Pilimelia columellifera]|uniref:hypothetical protein n=1 Tax=Pilimelia columellifera TaxID=706574 RepID=UPI0031D944B6
MDLLPALVAGGIAMLSLFVAGRGLRVLRQGWLARQHTARLLSRGRSVDAVVVGREPGTVGARMADLRPVVAFLGDDGKVVRAVADHPLTRRSITQPLLTGQRVLVAYEKTPRLAVEVITANSDGPAQGLMTIGMALFSGGITLLVFSGMTYVAASVLFAF